MYAMIYENKESAVSMTVRIADAYAEELAHKHPEVRRAQFPKARNWFIVPVDGASLDKASVFRVLHAAAKFVVTDFQEPNKTSKTEAEAEPDAEKK